MNVLENHQDTPQEKHLLVRGNFRSVRLDQGKATRAPCKSVMSELSHLVTIFPVSTWPKEWRSREGERRNVAEMDTSALPGRFPGPQQGRGKHWIGWIWHGADTWLTWNSPWLTNVSLVGHPCDFPGHSQVGDIRLHLFFLNQGKCSGPHSSPPAVVTTASLFPSLCKHHVEKISSPHSATY